ncbi:MAG: hypothetical protein PF487_09975, partial [Bacteroidales bacterium]|nr:hypothetical protein [Bacteroidales bacterium]
MEVVYCTKKLRREVISNRLLFLLLFGVLTGCNPYLQNNSTKYFHFSDIHNYADNSVCSEPVRINFSGSIDFKKNYKIKGIIKIFSDSSF